MRETSAGWKDSLMHTSLQRIARVRSNPVCEVDRSLLDAALRAKLLRGGQQPKEFLWRDRVSEEPALAENRLRPADKIGGLLAGLNPFHDHLQVQRLGHRKEEQSVG